MDSSRLKTIPLASQRDARWANAELGTGGTTIGQEGCTITAASIASMFTSNPVTPAVMNAVLTVKGGFLEGNRLIFAKVSEVVPQLSYQGFISCPRIPAPMQILLDALDNNGLALIQLYSKPIVSVKNYHWVLGYDHTKEGDILIVDPWIGRKGSLTEMFGWGQWKPPRIILAFATYQIKEIK